jgi:hypothetical protein
MSGESLVHLVNNARNVKIRSFRRLQCEACSVTHLKKQVSRRTLENRAPRPFYRIAWDLFDYP